MRKSDSGNDNLPLLHVKTDGHQKKKWYQGAVVCLFGALLFGRAKASNTESLGRDETHHHRLYPHVLGDGCATQIGGTPWRATASPSHSHSVLGPAGCSGASGGDWHAGPFVCLQKPPAPSARPVERLSVILDMEDTEVCFLFFFSVCVWLLLSPGAD